MSKKVLVDTNIFLDYYLNRSSGVIPIGEFAFQFFQRTLECEFFVVICTETVNELKMVLGVDEKKIWEEVFRPFWIKSKIEVVYPTREQKIIARRLSDEKKVPFVDALFSIIARERGLFLVTRDRHFSEELDFAEFTRTPEEL